MRAKALLLTALLCVLTVVTAHAQPLAAKPEQVGLSGERLERLTARIRADVEKNVIPGAVLLVARHGKVVLFEAIGTRDPETKTPMTRDAIFRIYSGDSLSSQYGLPALNSLRMLRCQTTVPSLVRRQARSPVSLSA